MLARNWISRWLRPVREQEVAFIGFASIHDRVLHLARSISCVGNSAAQSPARR